MDNIFEIIQTFPNFVKVIIALVLGVWAFEIFCLPFNINRLIGRIDKASNKLDEILKLVGNDSSIRADNSKVLSLLLGDMLENRDNSKPKSEMKTKK